MRTPQSLAEAKAIFREERTKLTSALSTLAGSRWLLAILAALVVALGSNLIYSPNQMPAFGGLSLTTVGLPPSLDFGLVGEQAAEAARAAQRQGAGQAAQGFLSEREGLAPLVNGIGFAVALALLIANMTIMTMRRRVTKG